MNPDMLSFREFRIQQRIIGFQKKLAFSFMMRSFVFSDSLNLFAMQIASTIRRIMTAKTIVASRSVAPKLYPTLSPIPFIVMEFCFLHFSTLFLHQKMRPKMAFNLLLAKLTQHCVQQSQGLFSKNINVVVPILSCGGSNSLILPCGGPDFVNSIYAQYMTFIVLIQSTRRVF